MSKKLCCLLFLFLLATIPLVACASAEDVLDGTAVLMNIPYDVFYTSEGASDTGLDAVSSETKTSPGLWVWRVVLTM